MIIRMEKPIEKKSNRGGKREGSGRPPVADPVKARTVQLTDGQYGVLKKAGGNSYLRKHLDDLGKLLSK